MTRFIVGVWLALVLVCVVAIIDGHLEPLAGLFAWTFCGGLILSSIAKSENTLDD
jgi:uncharacterized membrane protein YdcZ (DUF606 family)